MDLPWKLIAGLGIAFASGSLPFGYWMGRLHGIDIREHGSGNIGSTNVARVLGKKWGGIIFVLDFLKGWIPTFLMGIWAASSPEEGWWRVAAAILAVMAHNYTPWLGFRGGKGIATSAGVLLALMPWSLVISLTTWLVLTKVTKTVSIGSIAACLAVPTGAWLFYPGQTAMMSLALAVCLLGIWRHRSNIERLMSGTEPKLSGGKSS